MRKKKKKKLSPSTETPAEMLRLLFDFVLDKILQRAAAALLRAADLPSRVVTG